jgi:vacuolar protein sorting-associated protein 3
MMDLYALLEESEVIILAEVEPIFRAAGQYDALCKIYLKRGDDAALLDLWSKCATFPCSCTRLR